MNDVRPRPELAETPLAIHGGLNQAELSALGLDPAAVLDFSISTNPFAPAPAVLRALAAVAPDGYPDRASTALRAAIAEDIGCSPWEVLPGNGASEILWLIALAFLRPGDRVLVLGPTFAEYDRVSRMMRAEVTMLSADDSFRHDPESVAEEVERHRPRLLFVCNPANPAGTMLRAEDIANWARHAPGTLVVVDEAYLAFAGGASVLDTPRDNLLVVGSMTKDHALAGVRLGYAAGSARWIEALSRVQPPWSVSAFAQAAGVAALADRDHLHTSLIELAEANRTLVADLVRLGHEPVRSATHYFLLRVGDGAAVRRELLRRGILVRDCASFGLPTYIRIATRQPAENARLVAALAEVLR